MHSWFLLLVFAASAACLRRSSDQSLWASSAYPFTIRLGVTHIYRRPLLHLNVPFYEPRWHLQRIEEHIRNSHWQPMTSSTISRPRYNVTSLPLPGHDGQGLLHTRTHRHQHLLHQTCSTASCHGLFRSIRHRHLTAIDCLSSKPGLELLHRFVLQHPESYYGGTPDCTDGGARRHTLCDWWVNGEAIGSR